MTTTDLFDAVFVCLPAPVAVPDGGSNEPIGALLHGFHEWLTESLPHVAESRRYALVTDMAAGVGPQATVPATFDGVLVTPEAVGHETVSRRTILHSATRLGVPIHRVLVLASDRAGVDAGRAAGATVVHWGSFEVRASWTADTRVADLAKLDEPKLERLWKERPVPAEIPPLAVKKLRQVVRKTGLADRWEHDLRKGDDLWEQFGALRDSLDPKDCGALWRLWLRGDTLAREEAEEALGEDLVSDLLEVELLEPTSKAQVEARHVFLSVDGVFQLKEPPRHDETRRPEWTDTKTCLNEDSRKLVSLLRERVNRRAPRGQVHGLEIGTGSGYVLLRLCVEKLVDRGVATDIDGRAVHLARANAALNRLTSQVRVVQSDLFDLVESTDPFDLVVFHPPYRLLPIRGIPYPDPLFRHGTGPDGLGLVRAFLAGLGSVLAPEGEAFVYLDLPLVKGSPAPKRTELQRAVPALRVDFEPVDGEDSFRTAEELASATAEKCGAEDDAAQLSVKERSKIRTRVLAAYESQQITAVQRGFLHAATRCWRRRREGRCAFPDR